MRLRKTFGRALAPLGLVLGLAGLELEVVVGTATVSGSRDYYWRACEPEEVGGLLYNFRRRVGAACLNFPPLRVTGAADRSRPRLRSSTRTRPVFLQGEMVEVTSWDA